jgi:hypothetical protein
MNGMCAQFFVLRVKRLIDRFSVFFSVVTLENNRASRFCEFSKEAAELVRLNVLA